MHTDFKDLRIDILALRIWCEFCYSQDVTSTSPHYLPNNSPGVSLENSVLDQLIIP